MDIKVIIKLFEKLKAERGVIEEHWQELADYFLPIKATITDKKTPGDKLGTVLYDSTGLDSVNVFSAGLNSYLTNPASKWFNLGLKDKELSESQDVKEWLKESEYRIFSALNDSNFNLQVHGVYKNFGTFGTPCLYEEQDFKDLIRFHSRPPGEIFIMENEREAVDIVFREFVFTVRQAYNQWGERLSDDIKSKYASGNYNENYRFLHCVMPRHERMAGKLDSLNKPYASYYIELEKQILLEESGYDEFPFFVPRSNKKSGEVYGYSQAMIALPDMKTLNAMQKTILKAAQKQVDPPMSVPNDGYLLPIRTTPGAVNIRTSTSPDDKIEYQEFRGQLQLGIEMINLRQQMVKRALFVDLFLLLAQEPQMTATEVRERVFEKMLILAPLLGSLMHELLDPLIHRTFAILSRSGELTQPPDILSERNPDYVIQYISPLAKAQRMAEAQNINGFLMVVGELAKVNIEAIDRLDIDKATKELGDIYNVPQVLRGDDEVAKIRQARAEQVQQQQLIDSAVPGSQAIKNVVEADKASKEVVSGVK